MFSVSYKVYMAVEGAAETVEGDVLQKLLAMSLSSFRNQKEVCRIYIIVILGAILPASALQVLV